MKILNKILNINKPILAKPGSGTEYFTEDFTNKANVINEGGEEWKYLLPHKSHISASFSFTGWPPAEPEASSEEERISAIKILHEAGFYTIASFDPILNIHFAENIVKKIFPYCDVFKFELLSNGKEKTSMYNNEKLLRNFVGSFVKRYDVVLKEHKKHVFWGKSIVDLLGQENFKAITVPDINNEETDILSIYDKKEIAEGLFPEQIARRIHQPDKKHIESICENMKDKGLLDDFHPKNHPKEGAYYPTGKGVAALYQKQQENEKVFGIDV